MSHNATCMPFARDAAGAPLRHYLYGTVTEQNNDSAPLRQYYGTTKTGIHHIQQMHVQVCHPSGTLSAVTRARFNRVLAVPTLDQQTISRHRIVEQKPLQLPYCSMSVFALPVRLGLWQSSSQSAVARPLTKVSSFDAPPRNRDNCIPKLSSKYTRANPFHCLSPSVANS